MGAFNKNEADFALEITGNKISANIFLKRVEAFYNLVRVVADDVVLGSRWIIDEIISEAVKKAPLAQGISQTEENRKPIGFNYTPM